MLDATPSGGDTGEYGYDLLVDTAYFEEPTTDAVTYGPGREVTYRRSLAGAVRMAYFEFPMAVVEDVL